MKLHRSLQRFPSLVDLLGYGLVLAYCTWIPFQAVAAQDVLVQTASAIFVFEFLSVHSSFMLMPYVIARQQKSFSLWKQDRILAMVMILVVALYAIFALVLGFLMSSIVVPASFVLSVGLKVFHPQHQQRMKKTLLFVVLLLASGPVIAYLGSVVWGISYYGVLVFCALLKVLGLIKEQTFIP